MPIAAHPVEFTQLLSVTFDDSLAELRHSDSAAWKEDISKVPDLLNGWFDSLPRSNADTREMNEVIHWDRSSPGQIRSVLVTAADGQKIPAESLYFATSAEVWVVRILGDQPGVPKFYVNSWYGMHDPCWCSLSSTGEIQDGTLHGSENPEEALLDIIDTCADHIERVEIKGQIKGTPTFNDDAILSCVADHEAELEFSALRMIRRLPQKIFEAHVRGNSEVILGSAVPYDRKDLAFYVNGELQIPAVREACPAMMQAHDVLKTYGFNPILNAELVSARSVLPFLSLRIDTDKAMRLVKLIEVE